jgi:hypothetical protein
MASNRRQVAEEATRTGREVCSCERFGAYG